MSSDWPPQSQGKGKRHGGKLIAPPYIKEEYKVRNSAKKCTIADCIDKKILNKLELIKRNNGKKTNSHSI